MSIQPEELEDLTSCMFRKGLLIQVNAIKAQYSGIDHLVNRRDLCIYMKPT